MSVFLLLALCEEPAVPSLALPYYATVCPAEIHKFYSLIYYLNDSYYLFSVSVLCGGGGTILYSRCNDIVTYFEMTIWRFDNFTIVDKKATS
jgi:hypothetical protein